MVCVHLRRTFCTVHLLGPLVSQYCLHSLSPYSSFWMFYAILKREYWNLLLFFYCLLLCSILSVFASYIWVLWCWVYVYLELLYLPGELTLLSLCSVLLGLLWQFLTESLFCLIQVWPLLFPLGYICMEHLLSIILLSAHVCPYN